MNKRYSFSVVNDDRVNAFAHLGGHIYCYRGLINLVKNDNDLQFVLAHEIGHVELAHCAKGSLPGAVAERTAGKLAKFPVDILNHLVRLSYSEDDELDADAWAYRRLKAKGGNDAGILSFLYTLLEHQRAEHTGESNQNQPAQRRQPFHRLGV